MRSQLLRKSKCSKSHALQKPATAYLGGWSSTPASHPHSPTPRSLQHATSEVFQTPRPPWDRGIDLLLFALRCTLSRGRGPGPNQPKPKPNQTPTRTAPHRPFRFAHLNPPVPSPPLLSSPPRRPLPIPISLPSPPPPPPPQSGTLRVARGRARPIRSSSAGGCPPTRFPPVPGVGVRSARSRRRVRGPCREVRRRRRSRGVGFLGSRPGERSIGWRGRGGLFCFFAMGMVPNGLLPNASAGVTRRLDGERWAAAEVRTAELIARIQPNADSERRRRAVYDYVRRLITNCLSCQV